jgi:hypothetical protein
MYPQYDNNNFKSKKKVLQLQVDLQHAEVGHNLI